MNYSEAQLLEMQEETNKIVESLESQKLEGSVAASFIYALFVIVAISMIFEYFVKKYRKEKRDKKKAGEPLREIRGKLLITYGVHIFVLLITWIICSDVLQITDVYSGFLIVVAVYIVEIAPLFTIHLNLNEKEENK